MRTTAGQPGYLLVELVAAVTLLGVAVAALLPAVAGRSEASRRAELIERLTDLDERARLLSVREGPIRLAMGPAARELVVTHADNPVPILLLELPRTEVQLLDPDTLEELGWILFDRLGRSEDYLLLLRDPGGGEDRLRVHGLTGRVSRDTPGGAP